MRKRILLVLVMGLLAGASFAQVSSSTDSTKIIDSTFVPHLRYKVDRKNLTYKPELLNKKPGKSLKERQETEETPFYSNMPMAKISKKRMPPILSSKADSAKHYHMFKKRYKVIPITKEEDKLPAKD